ncbi:MAG: DUF1552 domain-containing protein [Myxococcaceae bacterium]|nr:DUF1552 domain-containing protein [Myxococcaceae bacterium]
MSRHTRRSFLAGAGATLALPLLDRDVGRAFGQSTPTVPKRLVVFIHGQGTLNNSQADQWNPVAQPGGALELSGRPMLEMLAPHQRKMVVISGVSNVLHSDGFFVPGNGHVGPGHTLLTAALPQTAWSNGAYVPRANQVAMGWDTKCMGPSIDHAIAARLGGPDSLHIGATGAGEGEYKMFYRTTTDPDGANTSAGMVTGARNVFNQYLATITPPPVPSRADRMRGKRRDVLSAVRESFGSLYREVGRDDRLRLEQHAQRISELEASISMPPPAVQCSGLMQQLPPGYPGGEDLESTAQINNIVQMLTCGVRNVITLKHEDYHGPGLGFLGTAGDVPASAQSFFPIQGDPNWHARVHRDAGSAADHPVLVHGFRFYGKQFKTLLDKMDAVVEPNGKTLLDNSLVLWLSEFGDGGAHSSTNLPVVLAGGLQGALRTNRYINLRGGGTEYSTGDLYTSLLNLFGFNDTTFGYVGTGLQHGGIPGLV